ncbi:MAG: biotin/lipoyl-containing protein [Gemmatimonadota bacterium]|jgi:biotin carboxyl carrier protein|nr:biotin/lipoyl-containing protein [Gemmatimonadota bacterium]MDP6530162.1 biotin/lipoyl-containing protein [Gemmatimonadota bacterium]MDP6802995.1 biotin/lipoyl-containing protein [Gemmatimonadota bacterium]MDP7032580.1 biotin/lipoyl-containing protein [Gemmatimonadota bacterium]
MSNSGIRYFVDYKGKERVVDLEEKDGVLVLHLDGEPVDADLRVISAPSLHSLLLDGHSREMVLSREGDEITVSLDGERIVLRVQDEVGRALAAFTEGTGSGALDVLAPMPGVVVEVLVKPGETVTTGQPVLVLEAMKMQNELTSESDGVVDVVHVAAGDTVESGAVLVSIQPGEES